MVVANPGQAVVETKVFSARAEKLLTADERAAIVEMISYNPTCGDLIQGTGGLRKVRFGAEGRGKSGGVRVIYFYYTDAMPIVLMAVYAKNEQANLSDAEKRALATMAAEAKRAAHAKKERK